jgi:uncharacterized protein (DUF169 family)
VTFLDAPPSGVTKFAGTKPSGCSFWRLAAAGRTFYTVPENHFNCAVGAYTHNISLSPAREKETEQTLKRAVLQRGRQCHARGTPITSLRCIGNRVYTGLSRDELYVVVRGKDLPAIADALETILSANTALLNYAKGRRQDLVSA